MQNEFEAAVSDAVKKEKQLSTRLIYRIWDLLKEPTKILQAMGDKAATIGRREYSIGRIKGLHDFWADIGNSPTAQQVRAQFDKSFQEKQIDDDETWSQAEKFGAALEGGLLKTQSDISTSCN